MSQAWFLTEVLWDTCVLCWIWTLYHFSASLSICIKCHRAPQCQWGGDCGELLARTRDMQPTGGCCCTAPANTNWGSSATKPSKSRGSGIAFASTMVNKNTYLLLLTKSTIQTLYSLENRNVLNTSGAKRAFKNVMHPKLWFWSINSPTLMQVLLICAMS